jgi:hypothetical protein
MDIATMRHSIEGRSPILDQEMIMLANKIPFNLKIKNGESKYIFKKALEEIVPKENLYREKIMFDIFIMLIVIFWFVEKSSFVFPRIWTAIEKYSLVQRKFAVFLWSKSSRPSLLTHL